MLLLFVLEINHQPFKHLIHRGINSSTELRKILLQWGQNGFQLSSDRGDASLSNRRNHLILDFFDLRFGVGPTGEPTQQTGLFTTTLELVHLGCDLGSKILGFGNNLIESTIQVQKLIIERSGRCSGIVHAEILAFG